MKNNVDFLCPRLKALYAVMDETVSNLCGKTPDDSATQMKLDGLVVTSYQLNDDLTYSISARDKHVLLSARSEKIGRTRDILTINEAFCATHIELISMAGEENLKDALHMTIGESDTPTNAYENKQFQLLVNDVMTQSVLDFSPNLA